MMLKRLPLVAVLVLAAAVPLAVQAHSTVSVAVSTPEFGFRFGAPFFGAPVFVPAPVYPPVVYAPVPVVISAPRVVYRAPVFVPPPRVVYRHGYRPPVAPYGYWAEERGHENQQVGYWTPPGHARHNSVTDRYQ